MKWIRIRVILLASWLILFSSAGRWLALTGSGQLAIGFVFLMVVAALGVPRLPSILLWAIMLVSIATLLATKSWTLGLSGGMALFLVLGEVGAIAVTGLLAHGVSVALSEFEGAVANLTLGQHEKIPESALLGQGTIYREVRRARNHQRPLALISVSVDEKSIDPAVEKLVQEVQQSMMRPYKLREVSRMLCAELEDCAVIVQDTDHYLAVLPDTLPEELPIVIKRLRQKACEKIGVEIKIGVATLPKDSYTFDGLVETATRQMVADREPNPCLVLEPYSLEPRISE